MRGGARARAFRRAIRSALTGGSRRLHSIAPLLSAAGPENRALGGVREIPLDKIAGSVAPDTKTADFDSAFLPVTRRLRERWTRIYQAMVEGDELPPIDLYNLDGSYYVIDATTACPWRATSAAPPSTRGWSRSAREHEVLERLPGWTEADVYVEITRRWLAMSTEGGPSGPDPAIEQLLAQEARRWWQRRRAIRLTAE